MTDDRLILKRNDSIESERKGSDVIIVKLFDQSNYSK